MRRAIRVEGAQRGGVATLGLEVADGGLEEHPQAQVNRNQHQDELDEFHRWSPLGSIFRIDANVVVG